MQYKSPIKALLPFLDKHENIASVDLNVLKKRIFAEFELNRKTVLKTSAGNFSKDDFIKLIEDFKNAENKQHHITIANQPGLVKLLEYNRLENNMHFSNLCFDNEGFIKFISPYLAFSLGLFLASNIRNPKYKGEVPNYEKLPILSKHCHLLIEPVYKEVCNIVASVEAIRSYTSDKEKAKVKKFFTDASIMAINLLPNKYFKRTIDLYFDCGVNFVKNHWTVMYNTKKSFKIYQYVYDQLCLLGVTTEHKEKLRRLNNYMNKLELPKSYSPVDRRIVNIFLIIAFVFILIILYRNIDKMSPKIKGKEKFELRIEE